MSNRRTLLQGLGAALLGAGVAGRARANPAGWTRLALPEFLLETNALAKGLVADTTPAGQDRYLLALAAQAVRLVDVPVPPLRDSGQGAGAGTFIGFNPGGDPFTILHWKLEPGARIRTHAHTYGNVVTLVLEGSARIENYQCVGERDFTAPGEFKVRKTRDQWVSSGAVNLVSLERDYIHGISAGPAGARGLDLTTRIRPKAPTPYLQLAEGGGGGAGAIQLASWTYDPPKPP